MYLGAIVRISQNTFFVILGCNLIIAAILLWIKTNPATISSIKECGKNAVLKNSALGGAIGFLSGMVGIGGGIFLSPILNLMKWDVPKKIAPTASVFILVNSISGIIDQLTTIPENVNYTRIVLLFLEAVRQDFSFFNSGKSISNFSSNAATEISSSNSISFLEALSISFTILKVKIVVFIIKNTIKRCGTNA